MSDIKRLYTVEDLLDALLWITGDDDPVTGYTKRELAHLALDATEELTDFECFGCGVNTLEIDERYMVHNDLWRTYGVEGMLCIGCLEARIGRRLTPADFTNCGGNNRDDRWPKSERLADRLNNQGGEQK
jgi:hypothetical protein